MNMFMPEKRHEWLPGPCAEFENQILDLLDGKLSGPARREMEAHMADSRWLEIPHASLNGAH